MAFSLIDPKQLKRIRLQAGYTQARLAKASGLSQSIIAKMEAGAVDPTFSTLAALSKALSSSISSRGKKAKDVMTSPVIGVPESTRLSECVRRMKENSISQMPVFRGDRMVGTVTESQVMSLVLASDKPGALLQQEVGKHVLPVFAVVGKDTPVEAIFSLFRFMPAVLVTSGEKLDGIITKIDLLSAET